MPNITMVFTRFSIRSFLWIIKKVVIKKNEISTIILELTYKLSLIANALIDEIKCIIISDKNKTGRVIFINDKSGFRFLFIIWIIIIKPKIKRKRDKYICLGINIGSIILSE